MRHQLNGSVALITGASSGIGQASALAFAHAGARVVVAADRNLDGGEYTARLIRERGGEALFVKADVADGAQVDALVQATVDHYGRLDIAHNNAGIFGEPAPTAELREPTWDRVLAVNLKSVYLCMRAELRHMLENGRGAIVNTASVGGLVGFPGLPAYVASKHGLIGLTKTAALEYAQAGIRVNAVCPGLTRTPMADQLAGGDPDIEAQLIAQNEPVGRMAAPEEIAAAVVWLSCEAASFVTGHALAVDGGWVAP
jgi:NAD(P)-dependent dehydrogenase (short-subunit alcohol dehydrogenase family)